MITALVFELRLRSIVSAVTLNVSISQSAKTGFAPTYNTANAVEINVLAGTTTSSLELNLSAESIACNATVPEFKAIACLVPIKLPNFFSNSSTTSPEVSQSEALKLFQT